MHLLRGTDRRRIGGAALCLAAMLGAEARAGGGAPAPGGMEAIEVVYAVATPDVFFSSIQRAPRRVIAARPGAPKPATPKPAVEAVPNPAAAPHPTLAFDPSRASADPPPAARPFRAWPTPDAAPGRALYAASRAAAAVVDEDFMDGFEVGAGMAWDPVAAAAAADRRVVAGWELPAGSNVRKVEIDDDPEEQIANFLGFTGQVGENAKLKLRYSNSRKRMKGVSLIFAWDF